MKKIKIGLNKFTFLLVFIYMLVGIGVTYAYFAFSYENSTVITGNVVAVDADLTVELVVGTNEKLVPMMDGALQNAIIGSDNGACIDDLGNLSCQVYKITLTNNASRLQHLVGSIELYPKEGTDSAYSNLRWQELSSTTQVKDGSIVNGMEESILVSGLTMESKESKTWYVGVWLSEIDDNQKDIDKGEFQGTVTFEVDESLTEGGAGDDEVVRTPFITDVMGANPTNDASLQFNTTATNSGTNGIYVRNGTENDPYPIYYYRGAVDNNLIFAGFCWKIVRTTETGGLKLIYNGLPTDGTCDNTGSATQIGTIKFNSSSNSPAQVGYMYGDVYAYSSKSLSSDTNEYIYSNSVSYANGTYTLTGATTSGAWSNVYNQLSNTHYTCFSTSTTCDATSGKVYYVYYTSSSKAYYITLNGEASVEVALSNMLDKNTTSSTIKGSATTSGTLDYWYYTNIEQNGYKDYIEDTIWCNDRSISELNGWNPNGGDTTEYLYFGGYDRASTTYTPDLTCTRDIDKFTVEPENGNGDLDYPVGLLTSDEIMLAGGRYETSDTSYYLYSGSDYWAGSPYAFSNRSYAYEFYVYSSGDLTSINVNTACSVRPSLSLKRGFTIVGDGTGTAENPYIVG